MRAQTVNVACGGAGSALLCNLAAGVNVPNLFTAPSAGGMSTERRIAKADRTRTEGALLLLNSSFHKHDAGKSRTAWLIGDCNRIVIYSTVKSAERQCVLRSSLPQRLDGYEMTGNLPNMPTTIGRSIGTIPVCRRVCFRTITDLSSVSGRSAFKGRYGITGLHCHACLRLSAKANAPEPCDVRKSRSLGRRVRPG